MKERQRCVNKKVNLIKRPYLKVKEAQWKSRCFFISDNNLQALFRSSCCVCEALDRGNNSLTAIVCSLLFNTFFCHQYHEDNQFDEIDGSKALHLCVNKKLDEHVKYQPRSCFSCCNPCIIAVITRNGMFLRSGPSSLSLDRCCKLASRHKH